MKKGEIKPKSLCRVKWIDHESDDSDWVPDTELKNQFELHYIYTVGFFLCEDENFLTLAMNISTDKESSVYMRIVKSCIKDIQILDGRIDDV